MSWRQVLRENFTNVEELASFLELDLPSRARLATRPRFVLNLPKRLAAKIAKNTLDDPILRQFVPLAEETVVTPGFAADPVCDAQFREGQRVLHKYGSRLLVLATSACAMHCRYCFRQNFPYEKSSDGWGEAIEYVRQHGQVSEVILSGGDPLSLNDATLGDILEALGTIPHVQRIRFHTRFPIGIPERIDAPFLAMLARCTKQIVFVVHCNHARELDSDVRRALRAVAQLGVPVLNQAVLLSGVNDTEAAQLELCETLARIGVIPYYLHLLDPVQGAAHFEVSEARGRELIRYLQNHLSGYAVPRLVREMAGEPSKTFIQ